MCLLALRLEIDRVGETRVAELDHLGACLFGKVVLGLVHAFLDFVVWPQSGMRQRSLVPIASRETDRTFDRWRKATKLASAAVSRGVRQVVLLGPAWTQGTPRLAQSFSVKARASGPLLIRRRSADLTEHRARIALERQISQRKNAHRLLACIDDQQAPNRFLAHH